MRLKIHVVVIATLFCIIVSSVSIANQSTWEFAQKIKVIKYLLEEVSWPTVSIKNNNIQVCVLGKFEDMSALDALNGVLIKQNKVSVKHLTSFTQADESCHILYISASEQANNAKIIQSLQRKPILMLSEVDSFAREGGSMNFVVVNGVVALTVNLETLRNSHLIFDLKKYNQFTVIPSQEELKELNKK